MPKKQPAIVLIALACGLAGCVAAPLAQIAVNRASSANTPCLTGTACQPGGAGSGGMVDDVAKGIGDSFHKLATLTPDTPAR